MAKWRGGFIFVALVIGLGGCDRQSAGFVLPPGDAERGQATFVELGCNQCHRIEGVLERAENSPFAEVDVRLGGRVSRVKTYGELVTAIIHPSESLARGNTPSTLNADGESKMPNFNERMSVAQLIDLTTFLQQTYELWAPEYRPIFMP
ncbi:MAG: hypothetical protein ACR2PZ_08650 [Pseudomonadales bacterium]